MQLAGYAAGHRHAGPRADRRRQRPRCAALEILLPDDAVRNLIRQAKVEQIYSVMQTSTQRGMQTMEQSLAELTLRRVVTPEAAFARPRRPDQLLGLLERANYDTSAAFAEPEQPPEPLQPMGAGLRVAEG